MNRYNVSKQVGDGTFGVVFMAEQKNSGETCAIKKMKQRFASWEECLQLREIISLRRLQHPNLIKLKEVIRENTELSMVFEFMGENVYQIMRNRAEANGARTFNDNEIRSVLAQTLLGLQAIHKGGFMHRDLKPENLLTKGDLVKIADFGLAKEIRSRPPFTEYVSTRWYRAPEIVLRSTHYNSPIDIWALGVIFAEMYINRPLFPGASDSDQLFKICSVLGAPTSQDWEEGLQLARKMNVRFPNMSPTPLRSIVTNAPPAALDLIEAMLRYNPAERPTATQCLQHPFFTGDGGGIVQFQGIVTGQPHNPFQIAAGGYVPPGSGQYNGPGLRPGNSPSPGGSPTPSASGPRPPVSGLPTGATYSPPGTQSGASAGYRSSRGPGYLPGSQGMNSVNSTASGAGGSGSSLPAYSGAGTGYSGAASGAQQQPPPQRPMVGGGGFGFHQQVHSTNNSMFDASAQLDEY